MPVSRLDLVEVAALADTGLMLYCAVKKLASAIYLGSAVVVTGTGGQRQIGVQYAKLLLLAGTTIVAIDVDLWQSEIARDPGAELTPDR